MSESHEIKEDVWKKPSTERLVVGGAWWALLDLVGSVFAFIMAMILSRLDPSESALFNDVNAYQLFFLSFSAIGFTGSGGKFVAEYIGRKDFASARENASAASKYNFLFTGFPIILFSILLALRFNPIHQSREFSCYFLLIIYITFDRLRSCIDVYLLGFQRYDLFSFAYMTTHIWGNLFAVFLISSGAFWGFFAYTMASVISFPLSIYGFKKIMKQNNLDWSFKEAFDWHPKSKQMFFKMFKFNILFAVANMIYSLMISSLFITTGEVFNIFRDVERLSYGLITGFSSFYYGIFGLVNPITQAISEAHAMRNKSLVHNYFLCVIRFPLLFGIVVTGFFIFCGKELIEVFYADKWVLMGLFLFVVLFPGYALASFASKYDNMLAGVGRPDVPMKPWIIGFTVALIGILFCILIPEEFLTNNPSFIILENIGGIPTLMNYNLTYRFVVGISFLALGMFIAGLWIIIITFKVFNIKFTKSFLTRPFFAVICTIIIFWILNIVFDLQTMISVKMVYFIIKTLFLLILFIVFLFIFGGISIYDARFIGSIIKNFPFGKYILKIARPIFRLLKKLEIKQPENIIWITNSNVDNQINEQIYNVAIKFDTTKMNVLVDIGGFQEELFDILVYLKINDEIEPTTINYFKNFRDFKPVEYELTKFFKNITNPKIQIFCEGHEKFATELEPIKLIKKSIRFTKIDYRMVWKFEQTLHL